MTFYDHFAKREVTSVGKWMQRTLAMQRLTFIQGWLSSTNLAILEIGPGTGELARLFVAKGYRNYTVVEPNMLLRERLERDGVQAKNYKIPHLEESDLSYDAIVLINVFEHLNGTAEAQTFVAEAQRVLRKGGLLCISSPDYLHWKEEFFNGDYTHANITTVRRTIQVFRDNGFEAVAYRYCSGIFCGLLATLISHLVRLLPVTGNSLDHKLYNLKTAFLRTFLIVGAKQ